jgi:hypothetical protein
MRLLPALILFIVSCSQPEPQGPIAPYAKALYRITPAGHLHTGDASLDAPVDAGYAAFQTAFPELTPQVNTVLIVPGLFWLDGSWIAGLYVEGSWYITVSLYAGVDNMSVPLIPHELLHASIGDPEHLQRIYWDKIYAMSVKPFGTGVNK